MGLLGRLLVAEGLAGSERCRWSGCNGLDGVARWLVLERCGYREFFGEQYG